MSGKTREVRVGSLVVGGGAPVSVQSMWDRPLSQDLKEELEGIDRLKKLGCDLLRFAAPDKEAVQGLGELAERVSMPLIADIHFDYQMALASLDTKVAKIRINPGNIGARWKVEEIIRKASDCGKAIRVGVNGGSLPVSLRDRKDRAQALVEAAENQLEPFVKAGFDQVIVSLKSSSPEENYQANKLFSQRFDYPLHLGITEAGPLIPSLVKSSYGLGRLLREGIGDTLRISISGKLVDEVVAGAELVSMMGRGRPRVNITSCPRCARATFDTHWFTQIIQEYLYSVDKNINVAIMGCVVNGPGEAAQADLGISGVGNKVVLFRNGEVVRKVSVENAVTAFKEEIEKL